METQNVLKNSPGFLNKKSFENFENCPCFASKTRDYFENKNKNPPPPQKKMGLLQIEASAMDGFRTGLHSTASFVLVYLDR